MLYMEFDKEFSEYNGTYAERYIDHRPHFDESKARSRRFKEFIRCTGLIEENYKPSFKHSEIVKKIIRIRDHVTYLWLPRRNAIPFVLTEPYVFDKSALQADGISCIELPESIGPYGGGPFTTESGVAAPAKSILCCNTVHKKHLEKLKNSIDKAAEKLPAWNHITEAERKAKKSPVAKIKKINIIKGPWHA